MRRILAVIVLLTNSILSFSKTVYDAEGCDIVELIRNNGKAKYIIQYQHQFVDTLIVPFGSELRFYGGSLKGPMVFNDTKLSGLVNIKGSSISGKVKNKTFDAAWLCAMDGVSDDAPRINEMINVCGDVYFPKGIYRLISAFNPEGMLPKELYSSVQGHIAICKSHVTIEGETGATFVSDKPLASLCVFSQLNNIEHNISDIKIQNINFEVHNDGVNFHEFMHTIKVIGVNGLVVENCTFKDFWGDAICLSHYGDTPQTGERTRNRNVKILNNTIVGGEHHSNRNGISVINGKSVVIKGNTIKNTSRKDMPGGVDIEPNNSAYTIENIRVENNVFEEIRGSGGAICIVVFNDGPAHKITIKNNKIYNSNNGILFYIKTEDTTNGFVVTGNYIDRNTNPYRFTGTGSSNDWIISRNTFDRPCKQSIPGDIKVDKLTVKKNKKKE